MLRLLVAIDGSDNANRVIRHLVKQAPRLETGDAVASAIRQGVYLVEATS